MLSVTEDLAVLVGTGNAVSTGVCHVSHPVLHCNLHTVTVLLS